MLSILGRLIQMGFLSKKAVDAGRPVSVLLKDAYKNIIKHKRGIVSKPEQSLNLKIKGKPVDSKKYLDNIQNIESQLGKAIKEASKQETKGAMIEKIITKPTMNPKGGLIDKPLYHGKKYV